MSRAIKQSDPIQKRNEILRPFGFSVEEKKLCNKYTHTSGFYAYYPKADVTVAELQRHHLDWQRGRTDLSLTGEVV